MGLGNQFGLVLHLPDAFDLPKPGYVGHGEKVAAGQGAGKNRGVPIDQDPQPAVLQKMAMEKREFEKSLMR